MCMGVRNVMCANACEDMCESMHLPVGTHAGQTASADSHAAVVGKTCTCQSAGVSFWESLPFPTPTSLLGL